MFLATVRLNAGQPTIGVELANPKDVFLALEPSGGKERLIAKIELEQLQTLILTLQAAEVQMRSWKPGSPRWP